MLLDVALLVAVGLVPSVGRLLDSVAYRNRARGQAEVIRAERAPEPPGRDDQDQLRRVDG